jgi:Zn-dependent protease
VEPANQTDTSEGRTTGGLPPEVEAELQRRLSAGPVGEGVAPLGEPPAPVLEAAAPRVAAPLAPARPSLPERLRRLGPIGVGLAYLFGKLKYFSLALKFGLPALKTGGTMLISMWVYSQLFGWWFAVGFVLSILAHELGHVYVAWRMGVPVTAPIFIPGFGALILQKRRARSAWDEALIGIGGPVAGTLAGLVCLLMYYRTGSQLMLALADTGFFINLFNLAPIFPLDGGWITGAISPRIWLLGIVGMIGAFATGFVRNPLIIILLILSLPRLWRGLKTGDVTPKGGTPTTPQQRITMGLAYVALCGLLVGLMSKPH